MQPAQHDAPATPGTTLPGGRALPDVNQLSLEALLDLDAATLEALYQLARTPRIEELAGDLPGRMLATVVLPDRVADPVRRFAGSKAFPWKGKTFRPLGADHGEGDNRLLSNRIHRFRFTTHLGPSRAGAFDALHLDYDHADNPFFIRVVQDELRTLRDGLWLGQAYLATQGAPRLVLYFGLARALPA